MSNYRFNKMDNFGIAGTSNEHIGELARLSFELDKANRSLERIEALLERIANPLISDPDSLEYWLERSMKEGEERDQSTESQS